MVANSPIGAGFGLKRLLHGRDRELGENRIWPAGSNSQALYAVISRFGTGSGLQLFVVSISLT